MINKELFVETINFIRDRNDAMRELNHMFTIEFTDSNFYPYMRYDTQIIKLLANSFDYDDNIIQDYIEDAEEQLLLDVEDDKSFRASHGPEL